MTPHRQDSAGSIFWLFLVISRQNSSDNGGVVQAHSGENRLYGISVSGRIMGGFGTKAPGNERIGIVAFQRMSKNKNRLSIRKVAVRQRWQLTLQNPGIHSAQSMKSIPKLS